MATLAMKIRAEMRMRELLEHEGMPLPDKVEYGHGCIRLFWHGAKVVVVVDIDDCGEDEDAGSPYDQESDGGWEAPPRLLSDRRAPPPTELQHPDERHRN